MERTRSRPLPDGRLAPLEALLFGAALDGGGPGRLALGVNWLATLVTAATFVLYIFAYTPLKLRTPLCTLVGAVPGALPPVTGWAAAREDLGLGAWVLFGILFLWQLPHTLAIGRLYQHDYARAGVRILPGGRRRGPRHRATDRGRVPGAAGREPAPHADRAGRRRLLRGALVLGASFVTFGAQQALAPSTLARAPRCCSPRCSTCRPCSRCWRSTRHERW